MTPGFEPLSEHPKTKPMSSSTETRSLVVISSNIQVEVVDRTKNGIHQAIVGMPPSSAPSTATLFTVCPPATRNSELTSSQSRSSPLISLSHSLFLCYAHALPHRQGVLPAFLFPPTFSCPRHTTRSSRIDQKFRELRTQCVFDHEDFLRQQQEIQTMRL